MIADSPLTIFVARFTASASRLLNRIDTGLILAGFLTLFIIQNLWQPGLPAAADLPIHLYRTMEYQRAWSPGVIIPRWAPNLAYGYGYPLFVFAPPLPYLLGLAFQATGLPLETALKALIILTIPLYAMGMYLLARDLLNSIEAGLVAATAYAFAPFALREALLAGGNVPQFLAIGLFPWTLWAMARAARDRSWGWAVLSAGCYAGVLLSHLFHALIFTPVAAVFGLILFLTNKQAGTPIPALSLRRLISSPLQPLVTIPLGLLLSAFFWLPAYFERIFTRAQTDTYLAKSPFFVRYPHWTELVTWIQPLDARAANPHVPLTLGLVTLMLAALGLLAAIFPRWAHNKQQKEPDLQPLPPHLQTPPTLFFALVAAAAVFLTLPISRPVWETITILQVAEFPWRMLGLANLGLAFLAGAALLWPPAKFRRPLVVACLLWQLFGVAPLLYPVTAFARYGQPTLADQINYERSSQSIGTTTLGEYLPLTVARPPTTSPLVETFQAGKIPARLDRGSLPPGATATLIAQNAVTHRYQLSSPTPFTLRLFQFDYPGWQARLDGQPASLRPEAKTGLILIDVPAGQHTLSVQFGETPLRLAAMALTGLTLVGLLAAAIARYRRGATSSAPPAATSRLRLQSRLALASLAVIAAGALWLKPLLRPAFTIESPPERALPAQYQTGINFAPGGQGKIIRLIGYDLSRPVVPPGGYLQVTLYWQTNAAPIKANLQPFVHLDRLDDLTTVAGATNYTPGDVTTESNLPTFHWDNARYIRDEHDLWLPPNTPPLAYAVRVGLIDPDRGRLLPLADGSGDTARVAIINVSPANRPPGLAHHLEVSFGNNDDTIRLSGFELGAVSAGQLDFKLAWQTGQPLQTDYTIFAHLLDQNHNLVASFDNPPLGGAYPTSTWLPGQLIIDPRHIPLNQVQPGQYQLIVGLYDPGTQQRLTTPDGADFVELSPVIIGQ